MVAGYLLGHALARALGGCPLAGPCEETIPVLIAVPTALAGMGLGATLAASRVTYWWEGVAVWGVGVLAMSVLVVVVGSLGLDTVAGRLVPAGWLLAAIVVVVPMLWASRFREERNS